MCHIKGGGYLWNQLIFSFIVNPCIEYFCWSVSKKKAKRSPLWFIAVKQQNMKKYFIYRHWISSLPLIQILAFCSRFISSRMLSAPKHTQVSNLITVRKRTLCMFAGKTFQPNSHFKLNWPHLAHKHALPQQPNL